MRERPTCHELPRSLTPVVNVGTETPPQGFEAY